MSRTPIQSDPSRSPGSAAAAPFGMAVALALALGGMLVAPSGSSAQQGEMPPEEVERFTDGDADRGADLYQRYCRGCHGEDGRGGAHTFMPHVQNLTEKGYIELVPDGYLYMVIADGGAAAGLNSYMPAWRSTLSDQEIKDVIAYIRSLPTY
jgi:mono/diheme cytochrome c family protein